MANSERTAIEGQFTEALEDKLASTFKKIVEDTDKLHRLQARIRGHYKEADDHGLDAGVLKDVIKRARKNKRQLLLFESKRDQYEKILVRKNAYEGVETDDDRKTPPNMKAAEAGLRAADKRAAKEAEKAMDKAQADLEGGEPKQGEVIPPERLDKARTKKGKAKEPTTLEGKKIPGNGIDAKPTASSKPPSGFKDKTPHLTPEQLRKLQGRATEYEDEAADVL